MDTKINETKEDKIIMGISTLTNLRWTWMGQIKAVIPRMTPMLKILDPTTFPMAMSDWLFKEAPKLTTISGMLVPKETMVKPTIKGVKPNRMAKEALPRTRPSAPRVNATNPIIKSMKS